MPITKSSSQRRLAYIELQERLLSPAQSKTRMTRGEKAMAALRERTPELPKPVADAPPEDLVVVGHNKWGQHALAALGATGRGSGGNGSWTKADVEELVGAKL